MNIELLKKLCMADGISGDEKAVRDIIIEEIKDYADELRVDAVGNIIAFKHGKKTPSKKLLISAHTDEVGFIVTHIDDDGTLKVAEVGGIDRRCIPGSAVKINGKVNGVFGIKPIHLCSADEKKQIPKLKDMYIDIGASDREEAGKLVSVGDSVAFVSDFIINNDALIAKAIDDRAGCCIMIEMIKSDLEYDMYFSFVVQEEVGLRGATCAAFSVAPDSAIVVESTTASDVPGIEESNVMCKVGKGAVISFMDRATVYDREYFKLALKSAEKARANVQIKEGVAGGNDSGAIHKSRGGVRTAAVSVPCRYLHSAYTMISLKDLEDTEKTVKSLALAILEND